MAMQVTMLLDKDYCDLRRVEGLSFALDVVAEAARLMHDADV